MIQHRVWTTARKTAHPRYHLRIAALDNGQVVIMPAYMVHKSNVRTFAQMSSFTRTFQVLDLLAKRYTLFFKCLQCLLFESRDNVLAV